MDHTDSSSIREIEANGRTSVERDDCEAKFWLDPVRLERSGGFGASEIRRIERVVDEQAALLLREWHEYFGHERE